MSAETDRGNHGALRARIGRIIHDSDTPAGRHFDVWLIYAILLSIGLVMLESVDSIEVRLGTALRVMEWIITILFSIEYVLRLWTCLLYTSPSPRD